MSVRRRCFRIGRGLGWGRSVRLVGIRGVISVGMICGQNEYVEQMDDGDGFGPEE
jgi:hypothetical protein